MKVCTSCKIERDESMFAVYGSHGTGPRPVCRVCNGVWKAYKLAKSRIRCGNVSPCEEGCTRHNTYKGLTFEIPEWRRKELFNWSLPKYLAIRAAGGVPTWDRVIDSIGYIIKDSDVPTETQFGNIQIISRKDNVIKAHDKARDRKAKAKAA